jgi:hypothetical protein
MRFSIFLFLALAFLFHACTTEQSSDVKQDRIFTQYELFYNANEDITYARAWFRFGNATGTLLELSAPSQVTFEGEALSFVKLLGYYEKKMAGLKTEGTFKWEDSDGKSFQNKISLKPIEYGVIPDTVSRSKAFDIPWKGDALGDNEVVGVWINGINEGDAQAAITIQKGTNSIIMPLDRMSKIGIGKGTIYMDRRFSPALGEKTGAGGSISAVYRPKNKTPYFK